MTNDAEIVSFDEMAKSFEHTDDKSIYSKVSTQQ